jgi:hypothetical protein
MLIQNLSNETEDAPPTTAEPDKDFSERICSLSKTYYASEASFKPPNEPPVPVTEVAIFLFQGLTAATSFERMKRTLPHLQVLRLLRALVLKFKAIDSHQQIPWARTDFSQWMTEMLKVRSHTIRPRVQFLIL